MAENLHPKISIDPNICHGKPVISGTRVLVANVLGSLASGQSRAGILEDYPEIKDEEITAALEFASRMAQFESFDYAAA
jgi:uncharacterized protein (DUF433 family)